MNNNSWIFNACTMLTRRMDSTEQSNSSPTHLLVCLPPLLLLLLLLLVMSLLWWCLHVWRICDDILRLLAARIDLTPCTPCAVAWCGDC